MGRPNKDATSTGTHRHRCSHSSQSSISTGLSAVPSVSVYAFIVLDSLISSVGLTTMVGGGCACACTCEDECCGVMPCFYICSCICICICFYFLAPGSGLQAPAAFLYRIFYRYCRCYEAVAGSAGGVATIAGCCLSSSPRVE